MAELLNRVLTFLLRLVLLAFGLVFTASLLVAGAMLAVAAVVIGLLTGRRPAWQTRFGADPQAPWQRFRRPAGGGRTGPGIRPRPGAGDVIDAEVREVVPSEKA